MALKFLKKKEIISGIVVLVVALYLSLGIVRNISEYHSDSTAVYPAEKAAISHYFIDLVKESGIRIRRPFVSHDNYIFLEVSPNDTFLVAFYNSRKKAGSFVVDGGPWAEKTNGRGLKPILHLIPAHIVEKGYTEIAVSPIRGDGDFSVANIRTELFDEKPRGFQAEYNQIDFEIKQLELDISKKNFEKIQKKRDEALKSGVLFSNDDDKVNAEISADGKKYKVETRLKGDWTDHLGSDKWSFRIELKGDNCVWGLQKFSMQAPETRSGISPYLINELYRELGGVALRYDFIDVFINGEYKGVYALEEFFEKRVVEHSKKREGPIINWDESIAYWENIRWGRPPKRPNVSHLEYLPFKTFGEGKLVSNNNLSGYARYSIDGLNRSLSCKESFSNIIDMDLIAKVLIICDLFQDSHGIYPMNNARLYFNPVTARLEYIPFDNMINSGSYVTHSGGFHALLTSPISDVCSFSLYFIRDDSTRALYKKHAKHIFDLIDDFLVEQNEVLVKIETTIKRDIHGYNQYNDRSWITQFIKGNRNKIEHFLYSERKKPSAIIVKAEEGFNIINNDSAPVVITGIIDKNGKELETAIFDEKHKDSEDRETIAFPFTMGAISSNNSMIELVLDDTDTLSNFSDLTVKYRYYYEEGEYVIPVKRLSFGFFAAGHIYGSPVKNYPSPHEPFVDFCTTVMNDDRLNFGILTGDIVRNYDSPVVEYDLVLSAVKKTGKPVYAVPGNHDELDGGIQFDRYFGQRFNAFSRNNNIFLLLDPNPDGFGEAQIAMIRSALQRTPNPKNIFVFTHEPVWLNRNDTRFNYFAPNAWSASYTEQTLFEFNNIILPMLNNTDVPLYVVAGDGGAWDNGMEIFYEKYDNIHYIVSGMGGGKRDNVVGFYVADDGEVVLDLFSLNGGGG